MSPKKAVLKKGKVDKVTAPKKAATTPTPGDKEQQTPLPADLLKQFSSFTKYHSGTSKDAEKAALAQQAMELYQKDDDYDRKLKVLKAFEKDRSLKWVPSFSMASTETDSQKSTSKQGWCSKCAPYI